MRDQAGERHADAHGRDARSPTRRDVNDHVRLDRGRLDEHAHAGGRLSQRRSGGSHGSVRMWPRRRLRELEAERDAKQREVDAIKEAKDAAKRDQNRADDFAQRGRC